MIQIPIHMYMLIQCIVLKVHVLTFSRIRGTTFSIYTSFYDCIHLLQKQVTEFFHPLEVRKIKILRNAKGTSTFSK